MRIHTEVMWIMARSGVIVPNKQILVEKQIKYTKGSTLENKVKKKTTFINKCNKIYWQKP